MSNFKSPVFEKRRYDIEYLRIFAVLLLIPFHCAMVFFSYESFYVKSSSSHFLLDYFVFFLSPWHMPLLFIIAGISTFYALQKRTWNQYIAERTKRLLVPFVFSMLFIVPPQPYFAYLKTHPDGSLLNFIRQYFFHIQGDFTGYTGFFTPAHLWFILYLYFYSIISVPLFLNLKKHSQKIENYIANYIFLFLYPVIIGLVEQLPSPVSKNPFYYYTYFFIGFFIVSNPKIEQFIRKNRFLLFLAGMTTMIIYLSLIKFSLTFEKYSSSDVLFYILRRFNVWFWLLFILGYGEKYLNSPMRILPYASEMSYPFYILHQTIIVLLAYYIISWNLNVGLVFFVLSVLSFSVTLVIYHFLIRKYKILRFLFGMKGVIRFGE
ncbi:MAG: acyltransferase family protein [Candidatus Hydrogenedens sp.]